MGRSHASPARGGGPQGRRGSGLALAKPRRRRIISLCCYRSWYSAFSGGFSARKAETPQSRLTPSQLPFQGSPGFPRTLALYRPSSVTALRGRDSFPQGKPYFFALSIDLPKTKNRWYRNSVEKFSSIFTIVTRYSFQPSVSLSQWPSQVDSGVKSA